MGINIIQILIFTKIIQQFYILKQNNFMRNLKIKTEKESLEQEILTKSIQIPENITILYDKENLKYNIFINPEQYFNFATIKR